jgi:hypothetical protein
MQVKKARLNAPVDETAASSKLTIRYIGGSDRSAPRKRYLTHRSATHRHTDAS